jgi:hypothetical protein
VAGKIIQKLIQFSREGIQFVFGLMADSSLLAEKFGPGARIASRQGRKGRKGFETVFLAALAALA